jgi:hypothetical protein
MDDGFDIKDFLSSQDDAADMQKLFGADIFNLLEPEESDDGDEEDIEEQKVVKFKYSESKKQKMIQDFTTTYVNDYGKNDPYHIEFGDSYVNQVRGEIHAIYGNRTIVEYIIAMRKVLKVYREMYSVSVNRLIMPFEDYITSIVKGDIPGPVNHPIVRTNVPDDILLHYILDERTDPKEVSQYVSNPGEKRHLTEMVFDVTESEIDVDIPIECEVAPEIIQRRMLKSWLTGKLQKKGLDINERNLVYGLTNQYDQMGVEDTGLFIFDKRLREHSDIISWKNLKRNAPVHIQLSGYTPEHLRLLQRGNFIRQVMDKSEDSQSPEITMPMIMNRIEANAANSGNPVSGKQWINKYKLYAQGVIGVKINKYGRETYIYKDKTRVKNNSINDAIRSIDKKAEAFKELTESVHERFRSAQFSDLMKEIQKEQDIIAKYGIQYYTKGE